MSRRKLKRKMIRDFGVEKFSDRVKRKLHERSLEKNTKPSKLHGEQPSED